MLRLLSEMDVGTMNKRILMIAYTNYTTDARVIKEAEAAVKNGFYVDFLCLRRENEDQKEQINHVNVTRVKQLRYRGKSNARYMMSYLEFLIRCLFKISVLFIKNRYGVIHINNMPDFLVFSAIIPKLFGAKIILDIHDPMPTTLLTKFKVNRTSTKYKLLLWQEKLSSKFADRVITVHEPIKQDVLVKDGIPEEKIDVVANFADDKLFHLNNGYSLKNPIKLIFHGTITERTGLHGVLSALKKIKNKQNFHFKIIGEGDFSQQLKRLIKQLELQNTVDFENKFYLYDELPGIIKTYHIGLVTYELSPATDYMLPVKMLEYISLGIPFITIPNKAITYYLNDDECFLYDPDNLLSLTDLLDKLSKNPELILEKREKIIAIRQRFLWSNEQQKYLRLINHLIK